ncbi:orotate phosphoribosyltransferase [Wenzhouxiangella marina]|uniref:Orotate phosphoribosyltransferase n=1 Tax=Wenzhouxiangella marina TaxID=1579979 RepID=A0A0K0XS66_9GAMM|nr:orotate phosphoribosyltransferase [Wenzhouxiangella marina]AKS40554.1 orotate phosphoribosyltransferase [Wenzhouxiangella marina]MBB6088322.1 orotate phosphoribosyltransferase [Wenzhouxiangella marina]
MSAQWTDDFLDLALDYQALRFGEFTLKSGRVSPYFFNAGLFADGRGLDRLAGCYAAAIQASGIEFDMIFGPAYKGIPLAAAIAIRLYRDFDRNLPFAYNRKEAKDHGEGGEVVGAPLAGRVLIVDDVISAGTSVRESRNLITDHGAQAVAVAIALDRQERGQNERSAVEEVEADGLEVVSVATLADLIDWLDDRHTIAADRSAMLAYRERYGI